MSRVTGGAPIVVRPQNNIYTALAGIATLAVLGAVIAVFVKGQQLGFDPFAMN
jgi:hypothetical protein